MSIQDKKITDAAVAAAGVQSQPDKLTGTAAQNKRVFDNLVTAVVKTALNGLIDELTGSNAAAQLGIKTIPGFSAADIQTALEQIVKAMQDVTQGAVANKSITLEKLAEDVTTVLDGKQEQTSTLENLTNLGQLISASSLEFFPMNYEGTDYRVSFARMMNAFKSMMLGNKSIATEQLKDAAVTSDKIAALAVLAAHIAQGAVTGQKIANKTITADNIADGISYTKFGLTAEQVRRITFGTGEPSGGNDGDIYIQYTE